MLTEIKEGLARLKAPIADKPSKSMGVFYNPVMKLNRDISILLLNSLNIAHLQIADPLAATGVRSIRFLKELGKGKAELVYVNDHDAKAVNLIRQNLKLNDISKKFILQNDDANNFLLDSAGFDYIDIDPFGSPNFLLDSACKRISRNGILAVTATDTSALCGTYPNACMRKYWALPKKGSIMHETGLRILIRKIQLIAAQYDKALTPIYSYSKEHYMRVFLQNEKKKHKVDGILSLHGLFNNSGPMWLGELWDKRLAGKIWSNASNDEIFSKNKELINFLKTIKEESKINAVGFYDLHEISQKYKLKNLQKKDAIISKIKGKGCKASNTHFKGEGIRSDCELDMLLKILR